MGGGVLEFATPIALPRSSSCGVGVSRGRCRTHGRWGAQIATPIALPRSSGRTHSLLYILCSGSLLFAIRVGGVAQMGGGVLEFATPIVFLVVVVAGWVFRVGGVAQMGGGGPRSSGRNPNVLYINCMG